MAFAYRYLFGPVPSRRFGRSLGVDLVPFKTCPLNCRFCQLGPTPATVWERAEWEPTGAILAEIKDWLHQDGRADVITLGGSGEPTLHTGFGDILQWIGEHTGIPALLLSNGALFADVDVRRAAAHAAMVKLGLHAWDKASFDRICRPHPQFDFDAMLVGYRRFRAEFSGTMVLEVFVVPGINDSDADMDRIAALAATVNPDRIDLNSAVRPGADPSVRPADPVDLQRLAGRFRPLAVVPESSARPDRIDADDAALIRLLRRHPCTTAMLSELCGISAALLQQRLEALSRRYPLRLDPQRECWFLDAGAEGEK